MANAPITADMVNDAGIAASMAANANVIPEPSIYFQDFNFGGTMFDALFGNAEALGGVGAGISDVALEERMTLEAEDRKKDDPAGDAMMIAELGEAQRKAMQQISAGGITMSAQDWELVRDGLNNPEVQSRVGSYMRQQGYSDSQIEAGRHWAGVLSQIALWKAENPGQSLPPQMQAQLDEYNAQPEDIQKATSVVAEKTAEFEREMTSDMTPTQSADLDAVDSANAGNFAGATEALQMQNFDEIEAAELLARRSETSTGLAFGDSREGPVISSEYNASAEGSVEVAQAQEIELPRIRNELSLNG